MKTIIGIWYSPLIVMGLVLILTNSCKKDEDNNNPASITDRDGNVYTSVTIGYQIWMIENLKTTKYNDGTAIPLVTDNTEWTNLTTPGYCWYDNDANSNKGTYGALYNWYAVNTGKLCPIGWHVPTNAEWTALTDFLEDESIAGGKLKETGTTHWLTPNEGATNETGFTALPGGYHSFDGAWYDVGTYGYWWSTTEYQPGYAWGRLMFYFGDGIGKNYHNKGNGFSVRCLKD